MAFSHGSNDAQKTMGVMTLALLTAGVIPEFKVPLPVILAAATAMSLGTAAGGWRIIRTMGTRVVKLDPVHGFAAETTAASVIILASHFGMPVSTTHVISGAIMGAGSSDRFNAVHWAVARNIGIAWVLDTARGCRGGSHRLSGPSTVPLLGKHGEAQTDDHEQHAEPALDGRSRKRDARRAPR